MLTSGLSGGGAHVWIVSLLLCSFRQWLQAWPGGGGGGASWIMPASTIRTSPSIYSCKSVLSSTGLSCLYLRFSGQPQNWGCLKPGIRNGSSSVSSQSSETLTLQPWTQSGSIFTIQIKSQNLNIIRISIQQTWSCTRVASWQWL